MYFQVKNIMQRMVLPISELLQHPGPFTMFVPNNTAFGEGRLPPSQRSRLLSQGSTSTKEKVNNQFRYHIGKTTSLSIDKRATYMKNIHSFTRKRDRTTRSVIYPSYSGKNKSILIIRGVAFFKSMNDRTSLQRRSQETVPSCTQHYVQYHILRTLKVNKGKEYCTSVVCVNSSTLFRISKCTN